MKKMLRKIVVLVCVATLFVMPASTALAASAPVVIYDADGLTMIEFQPDPLYIPGGGMNTYFLDDMSNPSGTWYVPAGKNFNFEFMIGANTSATAKIQIFKNDVLVSSYVSSATEAFYFHITPEGTNNNWRFAITAYTNMNIDLYTGYVY
jgi:hypothetical protein